jgi:hypothetical protein
VSLASVSQRADRPIGPVDRHKACIEPSYHCLVSFKIAGPGEHSASTRNYAAFSEHRL